MKKKILIVDDSALMRRVICDIINLDERFHVMDRAADGVEALELLSKKNYDAVVLDVNMPKMNGLELLKELRQRKISARVVMASTDTYEGAKTTLDALSLGAIDFIHKPDNAMDCRNGSFPNKLLGILDVACQSNVSDFTDKHDDPIKRAESNKKLLELASKSSRSFSDKQIVAIASSTGGPNALQEVVTQIPKSIKAPVVIVQHMPAGFTGPLADRLDSMSDCKVTEALDGELLESGHIYVAKGGLHFNVDTCMGRYKVRYSDEPKREGVKPCANYMYESLANGMADRVLCVVLTGMGADGTQGIENLKKSKNTFVITQDADSCTVYGMPKSVVNAGLSDQVVPLKQIAQEIIMNVGVN